MKKKVLIITPYFMPAVSYGGPPRVLYTLAKELKRSGHEVTVVTTNALDVNTNTISQEAMNGVNVFRYKTVSNTLAYKYKFFYIVGFLDKVKEKIKNSDFILFSDLRPVMHWQILGCIKKEKVPYGIYSFGQIPYDKSMKGAIKKVFDILWVRKFVSGAKMRLSQTTHEQEMYKKYFNSNKNDTELLPLPVEQVKISAKSVKNRKNFTLLSIGRFHYLKGFDLLLDAVIPILRENKNISLILVGRDDGEMATLVEKIPADLANKIKIYDSVYGQNLEKIYETSACFILTPRFYEETTLAGLDSLSQGIPAIVTKQAEIPYLEKYRAGYCITNSKSQIQKAVLKVYKSWKHDPEYMKKNAITLIKEKYSAQAIGKKLSHQIEAIESKTKQ